MIKFGPSTPTVRYTGTLKPPPEPQQSSVRESNEYRADIWSIPHWKPNLLPHLDLCHCVHFFFFKVMMDPHGSLFPWAHLLLICMDDKRFDLKSSLQLIKALRLFYVGRSSCDWAASARHCWEVQNDTCSVFSFHIATSPRSQGLRLINARRGQKRRSRGEWDAPPVRCEAQLCCPVCHDWLSGSPLALSLYSLPGKVANKTSCRSA